MLGNLVLEYLSGQFFEDIFFALKQPKISMTLAKKSSRMGNSGYILLLFSHIFPVSSFG